MQATEPLLFDRVQTIAQCLDEHLPGWAEGLELDDNGEWLALTLLARAYLSQRRDRAAWATAADREVGASALASGMRP
jgi:hypothetical protein